MTFEPHPAVALTSRIDGVREELAQLAERQRLLEKKIEELVARVNQLTRATNHVWKCR